VETIENSQKTLARHAEHGVHTLCDQGFDQGMAGDSLRHGDPSMPAGTIIGRPPDPAPFKPDAVGDRKNCERS
jgi:hypothetical protein